MKRHEITESLEEFKAINGQSSAIPGRVNPKTKKTNKKILDKQTVEILNKK